MPDRVTMLTIAPDTCPCSALNAELSTLNSWMLASGGSKMSEPNVRLLVVTPLTRNPTASSRLPAVLKASAPTPRIGRGGEPGLRRRHRPRHEQTEIGEVAAVQRNLLHGLRRDDVADGGRRAIDERDLRADDDGFAPVADLQAKVAHQRAADVDGQRLDDLGSETGRCRRDLVRPGGDRGDVIASFGIGGDGTVETGRRVAHADRAPGITAPDASNTRPCSVALD